MLIKVSWVELEPELLILFILSVFKNYSRIKATNQQTENQQTKQKYRSVLEIIPFVIIL